MKYHDIYTDEVFTISELEAIYNDLRANGETEAETFRDYFRNCTDKNGALEAITE